jgi:hypothetical protein
VKDQQNEITEMKLSLLIKAFKRARRIIHIKAKKLRFDHTEDIIAKPPKKALCSKVFH